MTSSIRTFLLINLLLSITLITSLAIVADIFLEHDDLRNHLDNQLKLITLTIEDFIDEEDASKADFFLLGKKDGKLINKPSPEAYRVLQYQIWDSEKGGLVLKPAHYENKFLAYTQEGFSDEWIGKELWRVFTTYNEKKKLKLIIAERYNFRKNIEARITKDSVFIMLATYPFLGILIWIIVGRGLSTLKKLASALRRRAPSHLKLLDFSEVPIEIQPLVNELNNLFERLKRAFEREKRFSADAAHELRTPLAVLKAQTQVALTAKDEKERKVALKKLISGVDRSSHVVEQLLTLSRMETENIKLQFSSVNLVKQARDIIALLVPSALKKNIEVALLAEGDVMIKGAAPVIGILIRNLVDNAIRYTQENGTVQIVVEKKKREVTLKVIDDGPGIPKGLRNRVFERFYRVLGSQEKGTGLGLSIVHQIVKLHHAKIFLSVPSSGKGLEITVVFKVT